jgi:cytochrome c-type biogenesis protein
VGGHAGFGDEGFEGGDVNGFLAAPLAFAAGALTIFSPCVLPLAPIVIVSAREKNPLGPLALALGLALTFGVIGGLIAASGAEIGDSPVLRGVSAAIMVAIGAALLLPRVGETLERRLAVVGRTADWIGARLPGAGLLGQAAAGVVLALAWAPCAGPTLGAALALAASGGSLGAAMALMTIYALGAAAALLAAGFVLRGVAAKARLAWAGAAGRVVLGAAFALIGVAILTGLDHKVEAVFVAAMPDWLTSFATSL